ncbi:MAG: hypothetical protein AAGB34_01965 [Planctomycetota bacterium]
MKALGVLLGATAIVMAATPMVSAQLAEKVSMEAAYEEGDTYRISRTLDLTQSSGEGESAAERTIGASVAFVLRVHSVEEGAKVAIEEIRLSGIKGDGNTARFNIRRSADTPTAKVLREAEISITLNEEGRIETINGYSELAEALRAISGEQSWSAGLASVSGMKGMLEPLFHADGGAIGRRPETGWPDTEEVELPPVALLTFTHNRRLGSLDDGNANIETRTEVSIEQVVSDDPMSPSVELGENEGSSLLVWNVDEGELVERRSSQEIELSWSIGATTINQSQREETVIERLLIEE